MKLSTRPCLHQFCLTLLSERGESYEALLTRKTRLDPDPSQEFYVG